MNVSKSVYSEFHPEHFVKEKYKFQKKPYEKKYKSNTKEFRKNVWIANITDSTWKGWIKTNTASSASEVVDITQYSSWLIFQFLLNTFRDWNSDINIFLYFEIQTFPLVFRLNLWSKKLIYWRIRKRHSPYTNSCNLSKGTFP